MLKKFKVPVAGWGVSLSLKKLQSKSYTFPTQKRSTVIFYSMNTVICLNKKCAQLPF